MIIVFSLIDLSYFELLEKSSKITCRKLQKSQLEEKSEGEENAFFLARTLN